MSAFAVQGQVVRCPTFGHLTIQNELLVVDASGKIITVCSPTSDATHSHAGQTLQITKLHDGQFLFPGFIDIHLHAPQYKYAGTATDTPLMDWLNEYAFPCEAGMQDTQEADDVYRKAVRRLLINGTTTALYFGTIHLQPNMALASIVGDLGQRAYIGKVCIDQHSADYYVQSIEQNLEETRAFLQHVRAMGNALVQPVITPRFIPTCSPALMKGLGDIAAEYDVHITSHISESVDQVQFCQSLHPEARHDAEMYAQCNLLTNKTIMAHAVFLGKEDQELLKSKGVAIAHCPLSNMFFGERLLRVKRLLRDGIKIGLGTDVAGGYCPSMLSAMRHAVVNSRAIHISRVESVADVTLVRQSVPPPPEDPDVLTFKEALWLATVGSAQALGIEDRVGSLTQGQSFDALLVDCLNGAAFDAFKSDTAFDLVEKFCNLGDDRHITSVWVEGRLVVPMTTLRHK